MFVQRPLDGAVVLVEREPLVAAIHLLNAGARAVDEHLVQVPARPDARVVVADVDATEATEQLRDFDVEDVSASALERAAVKPDLAARLIAVLAAVQNDVDTG